MISTVISFCTNDLRFLARFIEEALHFSDQIIVPVCDHFFNGEKEDRTLLETVYRQYPECQFIEFPYDSQQLYPSYLPYRADDDEWSRLWHNLGRLIGYYHVQDDAEWVLFADVDEIPDGQKVKRAFENGFFDPYAAARFLGYAYGKDARTRASKLQVLSLLAKKKGIDVKDVALSVVLEVYYSLLGSAVVSLLAISYVNKYLPFSQFISIIFIVVILSILT